jgi:hypothetical protein
MRAERLSTSVIPDARWTHDRGRDRTVSGYRRRPSIGRALIEQFGNGKWHSLEEITKQIEGAVDADHVADILRGMKQYNSFGATSERKRVGTSWHYRIFKQTKTVSVEELTTKLAPILEGLKAEGKKNMATMVPAVVAKLAAQLERVLQELAE